jgi:uncharacterized protein (TIGR02145 family)
LITLLNNRVAIGNFNTLYWSSTEYGGYAAWYLYFVGYYDYGNNEDADYKDRTLSVRCVRRP